MKYSGYFYLFLPSLTVGLPNDNYYHANLETFCYQNGAKREVGFRTKPHMYVFNATRKSSFRCHLELELLSNGPGSGFSVYIQSMDFDTTTDCQGDYLQFGTDILMITNRKSERICKKIPPKVPKYGYDQLPAGFEEDKLHANRIHKEHETEMDVWIQIEPGRRKELVLVITPHVSCHSRNLQFKACPDSYECVDSNLFCDGKVNCIKNSLDEDSRFCPNLSPGGIVESSLGIPLMIIIAVGIVLFMFFVFFVIKEGVERFKRTLSMSSSSQEVTAGRHLLGEPRTNRPGGGGGGMVRLDEILNQTSAPPLTAQEDLPPLPPSYSEAVGEMSQDPPKYSEIAEMDKIPSRPSLV